MEINYVDNEEAIAQMLQTMWRAEDGCLWENLSSVDQNRWRRVAIYTMKREADLVVWLANDANRKRFDERMLRRKERRSRLVGQSANSLLEILATPSVRLE